MRQIAIGLLVLCVAAPVAAQTNPCLDLVPAYTVLPDDTGTIAIDLEQPTALTVDIAKADAPSSSLATVQYPASAFSQVAPNCYEADWVKPAITLQPGEAYVLSTVGLTTNAFVLCKNALLLALGDWVRSGVAGSSGRIVFSVTFSRAPVTSVITTVDAVEQGRVISPDLRNVAAVYFTFPPGVGTHQVTLEAQTARGCSATGSRNVATR